MLTPGFKQEVCPNCGKHGTIWRRHVKAVVQSGKMDSPTITHFATIEYPALGTAIHADFCDHCGCFYAYEAEGLKP